MIPYFYDPPTYLSDCMNRPKVTPELKKLYDKLKCLSDAFYAAGGEMLMIGIRDGKYVVLNHRGEISNKMTYEEYMQKVKQEFCELKKQYEKPTTVS